MTTGIVQVAVSCVCGDGSFLENSGLDNRQEHMNAFAVMQESMAFPDRKRRIAWLTI